MPTERVSLKSANGANSVNGVIGANGANEALTTTTPNLVGLGSNHVGVSAVSKLVTTT
jgi:hypothetical protein